MTGRLFIIGHKSNRMTKEAAEELEEMGEDTSDMIMSQSKMRDLIMNATKVASNNYKGFDIQDELGRYKSTYEIMLGLSQIWEEIRQADLKSGDNRQNLLLESIAGKNRASIASSILQNPDVLQSVYQDSSTKATGSAMEENQKYLDSISGHLARLKNAWQELWANAANRDVINMFIDLGTTILNIINEVGGLQTAFTLLYGGTIVKGLMTADSWLVKFVRGLDNARNSSESLGKALSTSLFGSKDGDKGGRLKGLAQIRAGREKSDETEEAIKANEELAESEEMVKTATEGSNAAKEAGTVVEGTQTGAKLAGATAEETDAASTEDNTNKTNQNTTATLENAEAEGMQTGSKLAGGASEAVNGAGGLTAGLTAMATNPATWLMAIPAVLFLITTIISSIKKEQQDLIDGEKEAASTWEETKNNVDDYAKKYQELHTQLQNNNLSEQEQVEIKKQIFDLQRQIADEYGHAADGVNLVNGSLDVQLAKLRQIKAEEARKNLLENEKEYQNAQKEMEKERTYDMVVARNAPVTDQARQLLENAGYDLKSRYAGMGTSEYYIEFKGDASQAEKELQKLFDEVGEFTEGERTTNGLQTLFNSISAATEQNNEVLRDHQDAYNSFLEEKIFTDKGSYGDLHQSAGEVLIELESAVNDYNAALTSGDVSQIDKAKESFDKLNDAASQFYNQDGNERFEKVFTDLTDKVDKTAEKTYEVKKKLEDPKNKSMAESIFGKFAETKKISKDTQTEILDAAGNLLHIQRELAKEGLTDFASPLYDSADKDYRNVKYGNVDLGNRPVLKWDKKALNQNKKAYESWGWQLPEEGAYSTVEGASGKFGEVGYEIAFTPLFNNGHRLEALDKGTVTDYLNDIVNKATDKNGKVDAQKLLTIDADPKSGKQLILATGKAAKNIDKVAHYMGKDGAIADAMKWLNEATKDTDLSVDEMLKSMAETGNRNGIREMFEDTLPTVEDVREALLSTEDEFDYLQNYADMEFGINAQSSDEEIYGFIEAMGMATGMVATSSEEIQSSLDDVFKDVSTKIEKVNSLSSIIQKGLGQTGLSFTKLTDNEGNPIESDVSKIRDAYGKMIDFDLGSVFEETATGIKLNMDAYRQLVQEEEAGTKKQMANQRDLLEARLKTAQNQGAPSAKINQIKEQITELDMLASAYDGATSATAKYLAQQNAADYGDSYEMFRDTTVKRADELMSKGMIGTEEFRSIAQLFSYDSLAAASAQEVLDAYKTGYDSVSKYITEDATVGMQTFLDDLVALPEEYGKFTKDSAGNYLIEFTDAQEDKLAEHLNVSKDMLESFYDMLNALGFDIHFFRDGTLNEFDKLNQNINTSKDRLKELKENANDPNLIPDDVLDFDPENLNTVEELQAHLDELKALDIDPHVNPAEYEAWKDLIEQIENKIKGIEDAEIDPKVSLKDYEVADNALEVIAKKTEQAQKLAEKGIDVKTAVEDDPEIESLANTIAKWPEQIQTYMGFTYSSDPEEIKRQLIEKISGVEIPLKPVISPEMLKEMQQTTQLWTNKELLIGVGVNPTSVEAAKQETENTISSAQPEIEPKVKVPKPEDAVWTGASVGEIHLSVDSSDAEATIEEVKSDAEEPVKTPMTLEPTNSVQEAANQAGLSQGVTTQVNEQHNVTSTADTSGVDAMNTGLRNLQQIGNVQVGVNTTVSGLEDVQSAELAIDELRQRDGATIHTDVSVSGTKEINNVDSKVVALTKKKNVVTIQGNTAPFNTSYREAIAKLTETDKKKPTPTIDANNSKLKSAVEEAKRKLNSISDKKVTITASATGFATISNFKSNVYDKLKDKKITITTNYSTSGTKPKSPFNGTAHAQGTTMFNGHAYAGGTTFGNWGLPRAEKGALINELGSEIVVSPDGHWQILNGGDPTFANLPKGAIIFNHKQTAELLKNGYITGSHGKLVGGSFVNGTDPDIDESRLDELMGSAFAAGTAKWTGVLSGSAYPGGKGGGNLNSAKQAQSRTNNKDKKKTKSGGGGGHNGGGHHGSHTGGSSARSKAKAFLETLDAIEIQLNRVDAKISQLDTTIGQTFQTFGTRTNSITKEFAQLNKEIKLVNNSLSAVKDPRTNYLRKAITAAQKAGYTEEEQKSYKESHNGTASPVEGRSGTPLSKGWIQDIQNSVKTGNYMTIEDVGDEGTWKKIQAYQTWYEKHVKLNQKKQEYINKLSQLTITNLQLIQTKYTTTLDAITSVLNGNENLRQLQNFQTNGKTTSTKNKKTGKVTYGMNWKKDTVNKRYENDIKQYQKQILLLQAEREELQNALRIGVMNGTIKKGSEEYRKWTTQIANLGNDIVAAQTKIGEAASNQIQHVQDRWENVLASLEGELTGYANKIEQFAFTSKGGAAWKTTKNKKTGKKETNLTNIEASNDTTLKYINKEYDVDKKQIDYLNAEAKQLQSKLNDAVKKGRIQKGSEEWRKWQQQIRDVKNEIIETQTALDQLAVDGLEHIQERWETSINSLKDDFEGLESTIDGFRYLQSSREATNAKRSKLVNFNNSNDQTLLYLDKEAANYRNQRARLEAEAKNLETYLNQTVKNGQIKKNSQIWYEWQSNIKGVKNEIIEVTNAISEIAVKKLEQIQDRWETTIKYIETMTDRFKSYADLQSTKGYEVSAKYYQEQIKYNTNQLANMRQEASNLESALNSAVASGQIAKYSAEWFEWYTEIEDIRNNIIDLQKDIAELNNEIRQLAWDRFDRIQDSISDVIDEMEFLNGVIYENDLFDDNGKVTKKGMASAALIAQQFDLARRSADKYKTEILNINKEIAKDPYNQDLLKRRKELIKAQQESIENAQKQKQAMVDLAEKGIKKQIDAMNELISKYEEALDKQRQQEQYAKNIANQQKSIASLEKQLRSMRGDDSEEGRARRQQLEDQLKNARESLKDSQEDKRISDIKEALSELQERYQDVLNERLDNIDRLFAEAIDVINENGVTISNTIKSVADSVGYNMTDTLAKTYESVKNTLINGVNSLVSTINTKNGNLVNNNATTLKADTAITNQENKAEKAADTQASNTIKAVTTTPRITTTTTTTTPRKDTGTTTPKNNSATTTPKKDTGTTTPKKETPVTTPKKTTTTTPNPKKVAIQNATNKYNNAKNTTTAAQTRVDSAKSNYNNAVKAQKDAQAALKNAQSILTNAQNTYNKSKTVANKNKLDQARSSLTLAQARLSAANTKVSSTQAALNTANKNLTTAKEQEVAARNALEKLDPTKKNGLRTEGGHIYYYVKGVAQKGWRVISGYRYYFDGQGRAVKNQLRNIDGTTYYFDSKGHMAQRDIIIDDTKYKIQANGKVVQAERNGKVIKKYAKGTKSVPQTDLYQVDEKGQEVFINSNGKIYTRLEKGTAVLPHKAAVNLLEGMSNPVGFIKDHMDLRPNKNITSTTSGDTYNNVTFNIPNVTNYNEFMREAQRDPNFTKYIQEISLGKMNGNNSMKGRAVRFR